MIVAHRDPIRDDTAVVIEDQDGLELARVKRGEQYASSAGNVWTVLDFVDNAALGLKFKVRRVHPVMDASACYFCPSGMVADMALVPPEVE